MDSQDQNRSLTIPVVIAVAAALVAAFFFLGNTGSDSSSDAASKPSATAVGSTEPSGPQLARRTAHDPLAKGDVDAPVVMVSYSDFQCPYCGTFARETAPKLQKYVDNGTLRIEWRDFPYLGQESLRAAKAARAAGEQDGFWKMHDALYDHQSAPNSGKLTTKRLVQLAESVGLDGPRLRKDMTDPELASAIQKDFAEGQSVGVTGTPAFLVNGDPILGAQPDKVFIQAIEQAAEDAR